MFVGEGLGGRREDTNIEVRRERETERDRATKRRRKEPSLGCFTTLSDSERAGKRKRGEAGGHDGSGPPYMALASCSANEWRILCIYADDVYVQTMYATMGRL